MKQIKRRVFIVAILTLTVAAVVYHFENIESLNNENLFNFPLNIETWSGKDIPMEDWVYESLETPYAILRDYKSQDETNINLAIVWYDDKEIAFHAPESCLGGMGNKVKENIAYKLMADDNREYYIGKLIVERGYSKSMVLYYFINEDFISPDQIELRKKIMLRKLKLERTSAAFVRIMMSVEKDPAYTQIILEDYFRKTIPFVKKYTNTRSVVDK